MTSKLYIPQCFGVFNPVYGQVKILDANDNVIQTGIERVHTSSTQAEFSEDFAIQPSYKAVLYIKTSNASLAAMGFTFRIYGDSVLAEEITVVTD